MSETTAIPTLPKNASLLTRIRVGLQALEVLKDDAANPVYGPLLNVCLDSGKYEAISDEWRKSDMGRMLLDNRPTLQGRELDLEALAALPEGTLGHEFMRYFRENGLEPFVTAFPIDSDLAYLGKRYRETHDLFHLVTGYSTDEFGEMELQAFVFGNMGFPSTVLILSFWVGMKLRQGAWRDLPGQFEKIRAAYRRGRHSRELLSVRYERLWEQPVSVLSEYLCAPV